MMALAPHLTAFFQQHLAIERRASGNTCDSYAYAFKLLLTDASERLKVVPSQLALEQIDAPLVLNFLNQLETARANLLTKCSPSWTGPHRPIGSGFATAPCCTCASREDYACPSSSACGSMT